jgi:cysteinyl-tRNA synthetase
MKKRDLPEIFLTNSLSGKKEKLEPLNPGKVSFYTCGPTVYGFIHIGNLRTALTADVWVRLLRKAGYEVQYVRNYTDVDDKIINRANEEKVAWTEITKKYIGEVERDYGFAGMLSPDLKPRVSDHLPDIVDLIEKIISRGHGYVAADGEVLFSVDSFPDYTKLSKKNLAELEAGARVEVDTKKRNPFDFVLWKPAKPGEPKWSSPWTDGRPGWHIECSAMIAKLMGDQIDIHHGGEDLIFPHHENELAQSEAGLGKKPFVKYWVHNRFLTLQQEKMSKSVGNIVSARDFLTEYGGEVVRYLLLSAHYRTLLDYSDDSLDQALLSLERTYEAKGRAEARAKRISKFPDPRAETLWADFAGNCQAAERKIFEHFCNDLNTPSALGEWFTLVREFNRLDADTALPHTPAANQASQYLIQILEQSIGSILGIGLLTAERGKEILQEIRRKRREVGAANSGAPQVDAAWIEAQIEARKQARLAKDFAKGDAIRKELDEKGVVIKDGPTGTTWAWK